jgi:hypothetical protein
MDQTTQELSAKVGVLETQVDVLETELCYLHEILMRCGFPHGIYTLKATVEDMLSKQEPLPPSEDDEGLFI